MLFWPWGSSNRDAVTYSEQITSIPVIISLLGRFWQPASGRLRRYKYQMYMNIGGGGDMLCASLRVTVVLTIAGCPV